MTQSAVLLQNVTLTLPSRAGNVEILRGVDLSVNAGEAIGIVGPSGSGKTSLLMLIAGLERATSGTLEVAGTSLKDKNEDALAAFRRDSIGIIFQSFHLIPTMTALENVSVPLEFRGVANAMQNGGGKTEARRAWPPAYATIPASCPAASSSAWPSPGPLPQAPASCLPMNPPEISIRKPASRLSSCSSN